MNFGANKKWELLPFGYKLFLEGKRKGRISGN